MAFAYKSKLTIDHTKVPSTQTDFAVLVSITHARFKTTANGGHVDNGNDIRPYADAALSSALTYELEKYNGTTGQLILWVKIPSLSSATDLVFYLAYGDPALTSDGSSSSTWDSDYVAVYHLGDGSTVGVSDSTANANHLTNHGGTAASGQIHGGVTLNGSSQYLDKASFSLGATTLTVEVWANSSNFSQNGMLVEKEPVNGDWEFFCQNTGTTGLLLRGSNSLDQTAVTFPSNSNWHHLVGTITGTTGIIYKDGTATSDDITSGLTNTSDTLNIGRYSGSGGGYYFGGTVDEVRISKIVRSADYVTTCYNNQSNPSTFMSLGPETPSARTFCMVIG